MREIKFRVWNTKIQKMSYDVMMSRGGSLIALLMHLSLVLSQEMQQIIRHQFNHYPAPERTGKS